MKKKFIKQELKTDNAIFSNFYDIFLNKNLNFVKITSILTDFI